MAKAALQKLTPVLFVEEIEPCLAFWTETLAFKVTVKVPQDDKLGFVILNWGEVEVMLQSRANLEKDMPQAVPKKFEPCTVIYIEVDDVEAFVKRLRGAEVVVPLRKTFYGAREIFVRAPGGHVIGFSQQTG